MRKRQKPVSIVVSCFALQQFVNEFGWNSYVDFIHLCSFTFYTRLQTSFKVWVLERTAQYLWYLNLTLQSDLHPICFSKNGVHAYSLCIFCLQCYQMACSCIICKSGKWVGSWHCQPNQAGVGLLHVLLGSLDLLSIREENHISPSLS